MKHRHALRLYNVMFPIWMLIWFPSWLWLLLIPVNYLIDSFVLYLSLGGMPERGIFVRRHSWKICLAGFLADFAGSLILFAAYLLFERIPAEGHRLSYSLAYNPYGSFPALAVTLFAAAAAALLIYLIDRAILRRACRDERQARRSALALAIFTAPYLFLLPSGILYR